MPLLLHIALKHLLARKRQSFVSLLGIVLGVAFFLAISSLMQGSQNDFVRRLIDNSPHITISDEYRTPRIQPVYKQYPDAVVEIKSVKPVTETRGIRGYEQIIESLKQTPGLRASPALDGQVVASFAGKDVALSVSGMVPEEIKDVSTIESYMELGSIDQLITNPDGIIVGEGLIKKLALSFGDNITVTAPTGQIHTFKIQGIFRTGRASYDEGNAFITIKRMQALLNRTNRANTIIIKLPNPYQAREFSQVLESKIGYKSVSWQESSEDLMSTLSIRNIIMYTVVSAVLIVAAFGIYNVISIVVMEKHRDIAILKSMGFHARDIRRIFVIQGTLLGLAGNMLGIPFGMLLMYILMQVSIKPPGSTDVIQLPLDWSFLQFVIAAVFAMLAATMAALLPARKAAQVQPVDILRGGV
jgi:lipoprotein-releasing system permease protein